AGWLRKVLKLMCIESVIDDQRRRLRTAGGGQRYALAEANRFVQAEAQHLRGPHAEDGIGADGRLTSAPHPGAHQSELVVDMRRLFVLDRVPHRLESDGVSDPTFGQHDANAMRVLTEHIALDLIDR